MSGGSIGPCSSGGTTAFSSPAARARAVPACWWCWWTDATRPGGDRRRRVRPGKRATSACLLAGPNA
eukprot:2057422-Prymnesium_polylepis.1